MLLETLKCFNIYILFVYPEGHMRPLNLSFLPTLELIIAKGRAGAEM